MTEEGEATETDNGEESQVDEPPESEQEDDERDVISPDDFPTLELTLEEARRQYDDEERRRTAVENKIGIVVTVDALLISFGALFGQGLNSLLLVVVLLPALSSAGLGLYAIRSREYERPGKDIWDFHDYSMYDSESEQREKLLLDYEATTGRNSEKNNPKFEVFNWCIGLTFASLFLALVTPVAQQLGLLDAMVQWMEHVIEFYTQ